MGFETAGSLNRMLFVDEEDTKSLSVIDDQVRGFHSLQTSLGFHSPNFLMGGVGSNPDSDKTSQPETRISPYGTPFPYWMKFHWRVDIVLQSTPSKRSWRIFYSIGNDSQSTIPRKNSILQIRSWLGLMFLILYTVVLGILILLLLGFISSL